MSQEVNIIALVGSLRQASINKVLVETAAELAPEGMTITIFPLNDLPMYNMDIETDGFPDAVVALHQAIESADGLILATPEYNGSYSGVIKNGIDWASRGGNRLAEKPVITMGGSPGALGSTKAQEHLRAVCLHRNMYLMPQPAVAVPQLTKKIEDGKLNDERTREFLQTTVDKFYAWVLRFKG